MLICIVFFLMTGKLTEQHARWDMSLPLANCHSPLAKCHSPANCHSLANCHSPLQNVTPPCKLSLPLAKCHSLANCHSPLQNVTPLQIVTPPCKLGLTLTVSLLLSPAWVKIAANFCQHSTLGVLLQCSILGEDIPFLSNWKQKHSSRSVCWWPMAKNCQEY